MAMAMVTAMERLVAMRKPECPMGSPAPRTLRTLPRWIGRQVLPPMVGVLGVIHPGAQAQEEQSQARTAVALQPTLSVSQTFTSNVGLDRGSQARADAITDISPGLRLSSKSGRLVGDVDYALHGLVYARRSSADEVQQALSARGTLEAIDNWAYVDANASISQQSVSALGTRSVDRNLADGNRAEVSTYQIAPYVRGPLSNFANYQLRWAWENSNSSGSSAQSNSNDVSFVLSSSQALFSRLGWSLTASRRSSEFENQGSQDSTRFNSRFTYAVTPEFQVSAGGGRERNDYQFSRQQSFSTWLVGFTWRPSERTRLEVTRERRFFGNAYNVRFEYRTPRTVWTFADSQDVNTSANANSLSLQRNLFDTLYAGLATLVPNPVERTATVNAMLRNNGFLTTAASIQRRQSLSVALVGVRSTWLLSTTRNDARAADPTAINAGDLSNGRNLHSIGFGANLSHRLTPVSALSVDLSLTRNNSTADNRSTNLRSLAATYTTQLNSKMDLSVTARRTLFRSDTDPYTESALGASLKVQF